MKIVVVTGSPHKAGTSALLADKFIEGAESKGHEVFRFNAAFEDIHPCRGCDACGMNGPCVQKDAIEEKLIQKLVDCDMIVLVTPLYYFGFSAQLKTVIDRFYSRTGSIHKKKSALLATAWNNDSWTMTALKAHYTRLPGGKIEVPRRFSCLGAGIKPFWVYGPHPEVEAEKERKARLEWRSLAEQAKSMSIEK